VTRGGLDTTSDLVDYFSAMTHPDVPPPHVARYVPAKTNQGWPVVGLIALLTFSLIAAVVVIHQRTYKHPTDPTWHAVGGQANPTKGTGH
jgi:hypothetical protein